MAKYRHKTFEMFDYSDEAMSAMSSKSARRGTPTEPAEPWASRHLTVSHSAGVTHVKFASGERLGSESRRELRSDLTQLADSLLNDSRVLVDFESLREFDAECIDELQRFHAKLRSKGSQMVLCHLQPEVRDAFFPNRGQTVGAVDQTSRA